MKLRRLFCNCFSYNTSPGFAQAKLSWSGVKTDSKRTKERAAVASHFVSRKQTLSRGIRLHEAAATGCH